MIGHVGSERSVREVGIRHSAGMHGDGQLNLRDHKPAHPSGRPNRFGAGHEDSGFAACEGEQVVGVDGASGAGRRDLVSSQHGVQFAERALVPGAGLFDVDDRAYGIDAIRRWAEKEMVGDRVTMEPLEVIHHYGETIVRSRYDGTYDKTSLPAELIMSDYFTVRDGKIVSLKVIRNQPSPY
jgi:hypothetical protein